MSPLADVSICNEMCPAMVPAETIYRYPQERYPACRVKMTDPDVGNDRAPVGDACPYWKVSDETD